MIEKFKRGLKMAFLAFSVGVKILAAFAAAGVLFCSLIFILLLALFFEKMKKFPASLAGFFQKTIGFAAWFIFKYFCSFEIKGRENICHLKKGKQPILFISNHQGLLDPIILVLAVPPRLRPVRFLASTWIFRDKIMGKLAEATGGIQIPALVSKPEGMSEEEWKLKRRVVKMEQIIKILKENGIVGVFPQGEVTDPSRGVRGNVKVGTAQLMLMPEFENLTVVPLALSGTWGLLCHVKNGLTLNIQSIYDFMMRRRKLEINIGKPFALSDVDCPAEADFEKKLAAMSSKIAGKIEDLL